MLRALPWAGGDHGDGIWSAELSSDEVTAVARALTTATGPAFTATRSAAGQLGSELENDAPSSGTVAINANYLGTARRAVRHDIEWARTSTGLRDGLRHARANGLIPPAGSRS